MAIVTTAERRAVDEMKEKFCYVATDFDVELASARDCTKIEKHYTLPDGQVLTMGDERFRCPEALFKPELSGLQQPGVVRILFDTIERCDTDIRQALYSNIVLSGGNSMFPGLADRMKNEIVALAPTETDVQVIAPLDRHNAAWIGGSMLSSLSTFQNMWITKDEYDEYGPSIVQKKCF